MFFFNFPYPGHDAIYDQTFQVSCIGSGKNCINIGKQRLAKSVGDPFTHCGLTLQRFFEEITGNT